MPARAPAWPPRAGPSAVSRGALTVEAVSDESLTFKVYLPQVSVAILTDDSHSATGHVAVRA